MKLVIDSNKLQSPDLKTFLAKSPKHFAVLTDYAAMEAHKGDTLASIFKSMGVLSEHPRQVIVLKGTQAVSGLHGRSAGLQRRLVDDSQTLGFPTYVGHLRQAQLGHQGFQQQLLRLGHEATSHLDRMRQDAESTGELIRMTATLYSKEERAAIRRGDVPSSETVDKVIRNVLAIAGRIFHQHPTVRKVPSYGDLGNTFIFRFSLCTYLLVLDWASRGGANDATPSRLRNDFVDMNFAAFATYFDGLLSADQKTLRLHAEARIWLMALFGCHLPSGLGVGALITAKSASSSNRDEPT